MIWEVGDEIRWLPASIETPVFVVGWFHVFHIVVFSIGVFFFSDF